MDCKDCEAKDRLNANLKAKLAEINAVELERRAEIAERELAKYNAFFAEVDLVGTDVVSLWHAMKRAEHEIVYKPPVKSASDGLGFGAKVLRLFGG